ncbi:threonine aldolase (plasmid) [Gordonia polyisoprenivorans VH2]|uniref:Threonine aldolase n=2 Tax=Gordonia polyisoprenivorans TaxID=84595 RepID=H6N527_GORPV|nr:beta-eliminating lyase-related protein [Gordonia polyisoprenivorans]AFA76072.1 threonine aldolase [Gordonia polyisoprenivorans VH2]MBE7191985.1 aminotransferase class V-fold PLP-dependent enzyme [Gordonia polyisoprenivorans]NKY04104.1 aminotransferase class V-fold PLP-dependent enzyme [Gordonia polyisoprenivorans]OZC30740.1 threonine aldolase [Gordonia polyisoprenivorans]QUD84854.1 aminotransferase class V-fold PLP-dependent enzyme [Gordonia polyisoprenivorans]
MTLPSIHDSSWHAFASDNYAGAHPDVMAAVVAANGGHQRSYGTDVYTERLRDVVAAQFGEQAEVFPVFNGTGANIVALTAVTPRWGAVVTTSEAHINGSEGTAPEQVSGLKILHVPTPDGKLRPAQITAAARALGDAQRAQPSAVSLTQCTEVGTVYTAEEITEICAVAHEHGMAVHIDGARLWNAAAALDLPLRDFTTGAGVDVVSLGGTKNGALGAEAVIVIDPDRTAGTAYVRKMTTQLPSKVRFISAQLLALFDADLGLRNATHANAMAARLRSALEHLVANGSLSGLGFAQDSPTNAVFARLPVHIADRIREQVHFYDWDRPSAVVRWMTSWDTTTTDVDRFVTAITDAFASSAGTEADQS